LSPTNLSILKQCLELLSDQTKYIKMSLILINCKLTDAWNTKRAYIFPLL